MSVLEEVIIVKDNPPKGKKAKKGNPKKQSKPKPRGKSSNMPVPKKNDTPPRGMVYRKGYTTKTGKRVSARFVKKPKKNPGSKAPAKSSSGKRKNPKRVAAGKKGARTRKRNAGTTGGGKKGSKRRNPNDAPYTGEVSVKKTLAQVILPELAGGTAGIIASAMGPAWLEEQLNLDAGQLTEGYRDVATSTVIALGGGMIVGRYIDKQAGKAWAIGGMGVAFVKLLRLLTAKPEDEMGVETSDGLGAVLVRGALLGNEYSDIYGGARAGQFSMEGM